MNDTNPSEEKQDCSQKVQRRIAEKMHEFYLELRKVVIMEFQEYSQQTETDCSELLSNVLLGMDEAFQLIRKN